MNCKGNPYNLVDEPIRVDTLAESQEIRRTESVLVDFEVSMETRFSRWSIYIDNIEHIKHLVIGELSYIRQPT